MPTLPQVDNVPPERQQVPHYGTSAAYEAAGERATLRAMERGFKKKGWKLPKGYEETK